MTQENHSDEEVKAEAAEAAAEEKAAETEAAAQEKAAEPPPPPTLEEQLEEMRGNYLRALAEQENYRKRMARELQDERQNTRCRTIGEMLGIYDLLQMAVEHAQKATDMAAMRQGLEMTFGEFKRLLQSEGVETIDALGKPFDPKFHTALSTAPSDTVPEGTVLQQWKLGFKLGDRLLRTANVVVSSGPQKAPEAEAPAAETESPAAEATVDSVAPKDPVSSDAE